MHVCAHAPERTHTRAHQNTHSHAPSRQLKPISLKTTDKLELLLGIHNHVEKLELRIEMMMKAMETCWEQSQGC